MGFCKDLPYGLTGDTDSFTWVKVLGVSKKEYEAEIEASYVKLRETGLPHDRDDIQRDTFNRMVPAEDYGNPLALKRFYTSELFAKLLVHEAPENNLLQDLIGNGERMLAAKGEPAGIALDYLQLMCRDKSCVIVDNGFGSGYMGLGFANALKDARVFMLDFMTPARNVLHNALHDYWPGKNVFVQSVDDRNILSELGVVDLMISHEVLEHTAHPVEELHRMRSSLKKGGLLWLSTFFNSCNGKNPSHLTSHDKYQDCDMWFEEVAKSGFAQFATDPRGVPKLFIAI